MSNAILNNLNTPHIRMLKTRKAQERKKPPLSLNKTMKQVIIVHPDDTFS